MKKIIIISIIFLFSLLFIKIPKYIELNNIKIIKEIGIDCSTDTIYFKEIIPSKSNNSISYSYRYYHTKYSSFSMPSNYYLKGVRKIISNCLDSDFINKYKLKPRKREFSLEIKKEFE